MHGVVWGAMWAWCGMVCWDVVEWFDANYGATWNVVRCGMLQSQTWWMWLKCKISVWCGIWRVVDCGVLVCGMLHNARCGKLSDVVVWCKIKMWWCNVMWNMVWCEMCCDVECGSGVEQLWDVDSGCVMWNMLCFEMWWCEMVVRGRLRGNVMSDVEYGGPRWDVLQH